MTTASRIVDPAKDEINDDEASLEQNLDNANDNAGDGAQSFEVPDKFRNKSLEDVIQSYVELEKAHGRQANEFGELRKLTDSILIKQIESEPKIDEQPQHEAVEFEDFVQDPERAVDKLVSRKLKNVEDKLSEMDKAKRFDQFQNKHPNWQDHLQTEEFQQWMQKSAYRSKLFQRADQYDTEAADELFSAWEERQELTGAKEAEAKAAAEKARSSDLKKASAESGSTGQAPGKTFRRADLIRMRAYEPEKYAAMQEEIREAYAKGNVK